MARIPSRPALQLALVSIAVVLILPVYGGILPPLWHLSFMGASLLLIALATCFHDRGRARAGCVVVNPSGPKIRLPRRR